MHDGGLGYSQNDSSVPATWKIDLSKEDWFAFEDNFGTSEEKAFIAYFKSFVPELKRKYDKVFLLRNERQLHIYSFNGGERFEPDYVLFLHSNKESGYEQLQVFIEPKGTHLLEKDSWKEEDADLFLKFYEDGTGTHADDQDFNPFTWSITDNKLTLNPTTSYYEKEVWNISMKDNTMTLEISGQDFYNKLTCKKK